MTLGNSEWFCADFAVTWATSCASVESGKASVKTLKHPVKRIFLDEKTEEFIIIII